MNDEYLSGLSTKILGRKEVSEQRTKRVAGYQYFTNTYDSTTKFYPSVHQRKETDVWGDEMNYLLIMVRSLY